MGERILWRARVNDARARLSSSSSSGCSKIHQRVESERDVAAGSGVENPRTPRRKPQLQAHVPGAAPFVEHLSCALVAGEGGLLAADLAGSESEGAAMGGREAFHRRTFP
ncbi:hypothetical protein ACLOJK_003405 [Asimina triloba]